MAPAPEPLTAQGRSKQPPRPTREKTWCRRRPICPKSYSLCPPKASSLAGIRQLQSGTLWATGTKPWCCGALREIMERRGRRDHGEKALTQQARFHNCHYWFLCPFDHQQMISKTGGIAFREFTNSAVGAERKGTEHTFLLLFVREAASPEPHIWENVKSISIDLVSILFIIVKLNLLKIRSLRCSLLFTPTPPATQEEATQDIVLCN